MDFLAAALRLSLQRQAALLQSGLMTNATFFIAHLVTEAITQAVIAEAIIYGRRETGFVEGERARFDAGLNCTTQQSRLVGFQDLAIKSYTLTANSR